MVHHAGGRFWERAAPALRVVGAILLAAGMIHLYAERRDLRRANVRGPRGPEPRRPPRRRVRGRADRRRGDRPEARPHGLPAPARGHDARDRQLRALPGGLPPRRPGRPRRPLLRERGARRPLGPRPRACSSAARWRTTPRSPPASPRACARSVSVQPSGRVAQRPGRPRRSSATGSAATRFLAIGSGVLLLLLGIAMPRDRRRALLHGGATLATVALVLFFLPPLARTALTLSVSRRRAAAGRGRGLGRLRGRAPPAGRSSSPAWASSSPRRRPRSRATSRSRRSRAASGRGCRSRPGPGRARSSGPPSSRRSACSPRSGPAATLHGLTVDRRRAARLRGAAGAVHARPAAPPGGRAARRGGPRRGAREGGRAGRARGPRALRARRPPRRSA